MTVFQKQDILIRIYEFVGPGHFAYMANVNQPFHSAYQQYLNNVLPGGGDEEEEEERQRTASLHPSLGLSWLGMNGPPTSAPGSSTIHDCVEPMVVPCCTLR